MDTDSTIKLNPVTSEQIAWTEQQPVVGRPSMARLAVGLKAAGLKPLGLEVFDDGKTIDFNLGRTETVYGLDQEQTLRRLITVFRTSGFDVGFSELGIGDFDEQALFGSSLTAPLARVCEESRIQIDP
jgi:hypothetical protein